MTSSKTLKKIVSIGAALMLALGGSLSGAVSAQATPVTNIKTMGYDIDWTPGISVTTDTASYGVSLNSSWQMDDVTALRGQTLTISSTASPTGGNNYAQFYFYASAQNASNYSSPLSNASVYSGQSTPVVIPQNAVAMRVSFDISWYSTTGRAPGTYSATPEILANGTAIASTNSNSGPALYLRGGNHYIYGVTQAFTTPASATNIRVNFEVIGCLDLTRITSSTTYTASLLVNGSPASNQNYSTMYSISEHINPMSMSQNPSMPVNGATGSFASGSLATWLAANTRLEISASTSQAGTVGTQYDSSLEIVDQNNVSLLKDCSPAAPTGSGTLSASSGNLLFTPDSATAALGSWGVNIYKVSDNSLVATGTGTGSMPRTLRGPIVNGQPTALPSGVAYYAKVFVRESFGWSMAYLTSPESSTRSAAFTIGGVVAPVVTLDATDPSVDVTDVAAPLPTWASNIVSSIPTLTKSLVTTGGSVALTGGDYADLKSITIGGKAVAFKIETTGDVNIPVPAGEAGKTADIVIVFGGGTMTVQDGIKYVAQVDVAKVAERPIAIAAGAKKITEAIADQIRQAAFANPKNTHIQCVAYAANSSAKAQAAAKLTAVQACGIAAKANPALKISEVSVVINKAKSRQSAVGIKVYKQN